MTLESLIEKVRTGDIPKWLHFWGHTPSKDGTITKTCFSQWWAGHPFTVGGVVYATAEHFMMAEKARLFGDAKIRTKILETTTPAVAKKLGRLVSNFEESKWNEARTAIVIEGNLAKFSQHEALKSFLLQTGNRVLVEASPFDRIWGIGMDANHPNAENPVLWKGLNLLGFALMTVREKLASSHPLHDNKS